MVSDGATNRERCRADHREGLNGSFLVFFHIPWLLPDMLDSLRAKQRSKVLHKTPIVIMRQALGIRQDS